MSKPRQLLVVQPYIPLYRVPFFERLSSALKAANIHLTVCAGAPRGEQALRGDAAALSFQVHPARQPRRIVTPVAAFEYYGSTPLFRGADAIVVPAAATVLDTHVALLAPHRIRRPVALWGHIASYVKAPSRADATIERLMMRRADRVLAYTDHGRDVAIAAGVSEDHAVALRNTIDTGSLEMAMDSLTESEIGSFRRDHDLGGRRVYAYIGALDHAKRVDWLAAIIKAVQADDPFARVLIAGQGADAHLLDSAVASGIAIRVGYADDHLKALIGAVSCAIMNPGRIGLLAVDALTLGLPIFTLRNQLHAPEADYLVEGDSVITLPADAAGFARRLREARRNSGRRAPLLSTMVDRFAAATLEMLNHRTTSSGNRGTDP